MDAAGQQNHSSLLSQPGIDVNAKEVNKKTALYYACEQGSNCWLPQVLIWMQGYLGAREKPRV